MSVNPRFYKGSALPEKAKEAAAGSLTWQAGQMARQTDAGWAPASTDDTQFNGFFASTQSASTNAGDKVWVHRITQADQMFIMCATNAGTDTKAPSNVVGSNYGYELNSCIGTVNLQNDTGGEIHVYARLADVEPYRSDTSDVPGKLICGFTAASMTAEGSGL